MRVLRLQPKCVSEFDKIDNPHALAYSLLNLERTTRMSPYQTRIRMSGLGDICPREQILGVRNHITNVSSVGSSLKVTFDIGTAVHYWLQNSSDYFGHRRIGWWKCRSCGNRLFGKPPQKACTGCRAKKGAFEYDEHMIQLENPRVQGHPDMFLELGEKDIRLTELKTINGDEFEKLTQPLGSHLFQVNGYLHYLPMDKRFPAKINTQTALILYFSKQHKATKLPIKAYMIEKDPTIVAVIERHLAEFTRACSDQSYTPPPLPVCAQSQWKAPRARYCAAAAYCQ